MKFSHFGREWTLIEISSVVFQVFFDLMREIRSRKTDSDGAASGKKEKSARKKIKCAILWSERQRNKKKFIPEERKSFILYFSCFLKDISVFSFVCIFAIGCWNEEGRVARKRMMIFQFAWRRRNKSTSTFHLVSLCLNFYWTQIFIWFRSSRR